MDVLACLAAEPGKVVPKDNLLEAVWGGAFVEEGALSQAIHSLRKALGDDARQPRYVQTIPKRGYRLVAMVVPEEKSSESPRELVPGEAVQEEILGERSIQSETLAPSHPLRLIRISLVAAIVAIAITGIWLTRDYSDKARQDANGEVRESDGDIWIVVLPFEHQGKPEDTFFADGLAEEITKNLTSFPSLKVISRASAVQYRGSSKSLQQIGWELGVDYVLGGEVHWTSGPKGLPQVRIRSRLVRVADDAQVWTGLYERKVSDIFEVQAKISRRVIAQLDVARMPDKGRRLHQEPTNNLEAFRAYLRGRELRNQPFYSVEHIRMAVPMFEQAVKLDPKFAVAWAELSQTYSYLAFNADSSPAQVEKARQALERALALAPDLPEVRLAQAYFTYRCLEDYKAAEKQLVVAVRLSPNDAEILQTLGYVLRRQGRLGEAIEKLHQAFALDPRTIRLLWAIAETYRALRDYKQADHYYAQATSMAPDQAAYWEERALNRLDWTGSVQEARKILEESPIHDHPKLSSAWFMLDLYEGDYDRALTRLSPEKLGELAPQVESRIITLAAIAREKLGDHEGALAAAEANRAILAARVERFPMDPFYRPYLAVTLAQLGRREEALSHMERAVEMVRHDAFTGPRIIEIQAMLEAVLGRRREAISRLARLLATPYQSPISAVDLRLNPAWDTLRNDPEFKELLRNL